VHELHQLRGLPAAGFALNDDNTVLPHRPQDRFLARKYGQRLSLLRHRFRAREVTAGNILGLEQLAEVFLSSIFAIRHGAVKFRSLRRILGVAVVNDADSVAHGTALHLPESLSAPVLVALLSVLAQQVGAFH
jgi:hypothetical protein